MSTNSEKDILFSWEQELLSNEIFGNRGKDIVEKDVFLQKLKEKNYQIIVDLRLEPLESKTTNSPSVNQRIEKFEIDVVKSSLLPFYPRDSIMLTLNSLKNLSINLLKNYSIIFDVKLIKDNDMKRTVSYSSYILDNHLLLAIDDQLNWNKKIDNEDENDKRTNPIRFNKTTLLNKDIIGFKKLEEQGLISSSWEVKESNISAIFAHPYKKTMIFPYKKKIQTTTSVWSVEMDSISKKETISEVLLFLDKGFFDLNLSGERYI
jgi:hypothetical protein